MKAGSMLIGRGIGASVAGTAEFFR